MSKFPVEYNHQDSDSLVDAVNYLLSGPSNLGQFFTGASSYGTSQMTGNFRPPYATTPVIKNGLGASGSTTIEVADSEGIRTGMTVTGTGVGVAAVVNTVNADNVVVSVANADAVSGLVQFDNQTTTPLFVAPIALAAGTYIDPYTKQFNFAVAQPSPPFQEGNSLLVQGTSVTDYNIWYRGPGVIECTTTYVILRSVAAVTAAGPSAGGTVVFTATVPAPTVGATPLPDRWISTDQTVNSSVLGPLDQVFVSGQLNNSFTVVTTASATTLKYSVAINRYSAYPTADPNVPAYLYSSATTVARVDREVLTAAAAGTYNIANLETIFNTVTDNPGSGFYLYRLEVCWRVTTTGGAGQVTASTIGLRNLTAQVIKQ